MPIFEYVCPKCKYGFELLRPVNESNELAPCPQCKGSAKRVISGFSFYAASPPDSPLRKKDKMQDRYWHTLQKQDGERKKNPDVLKEWRKDREKACGKGPEAWVEWHQQEKKKEQKKKDYGTGWLRREA